MELNVGLVDRFLRIGLGATLLVLAVTGTIGAWGYLGLIPLVTGLAARCPVYSLFNIRTCKTNQT